jgi:hypothetical protein
MPREQLPQPSVVTTGHRGDQLVVIHRFSIAFCRQPDSLRRQDFFARPAGFVAHIEHCSPSPELVRVS